jgi:uncharacterized integral membrane protein
MTYQPFYYIIRLREGFDILNILIAVIIVLIVSIFSVQNSAPVAISFLFWQFQASLAIVVFLCVLSGVIVGAALTFLLRIKRQRKTRLSGPEGFERKSRI